MKQGADGNNLFGMHGGADNDENDDGERKGLMSDGGAVKQMIRQR